MSLNPYEPPAAPNKQVSWWESLLRWLSPPAAKPELQFPDGGKLIVEGIAFYLDMFDATRLYAASPSAVDTEERMNLVVAEAVRTFPIFLRDNPGALPLIRGRKMTVRLIQDYAEDPKRYVREYVPEWDYVGAMVGDNKNVD